MGLRVPPGIPSARTMTVPLDLRELFPVTQRLLIHPEKLWEEGLEVSGAHLAAALALRLCAHSVVSSIAWSLCVRGSWSGFECELLEPDPICFDTVISSWYHG